jgi:hypothetical protein
MDINVPDLVGWRVKVADTRDNTGTIPCCITDIYHMINPVAEVNKTCHKTQSVMSGNTMV